MEVASGGGYLPRPRSARWIIVLVYTKTAQTWWFFNSFTVANGYNFGAQWQNGRGRRFFLPTNKTFEGICLVLAGKFLQKKSGILFVFKILRWLEIPKFTLSYDYGISADVSILVTGFGRFRTVFIYALFGLNLGNPVWTGFGRFVET